MCMAYSIGSSTFVLATRRQPPSKRLMEAVHSHTEAILPLHISPAPPFLLTAVHMTMGAPASNDPHTLSPYDKHLRHTAIEDRPT